MEEKLVSYEVAKFAHQLGFAEKVMFGIKESGDHFVGKSPYDWNGDKTTTCFSCPSHGHLYRWIMKHGIYIDIETIISRGKVAFKVIIQYGKCLRCVKVLPKNYECYDAAWDAGLLYALKLIFGGHHNCKHDHCKEDDCCDEHEHHDHCKDEHEHCEHEHDHEHKHCEEHEHHEDCDHEHGHECCHEHKEEHSHEEHHEHHSDHGIQFQDGDKNFEIKDEESDESDKKSHDKKSDKGK